METNMSFWSLFSPALLVSLVLLVIGIVIIRFTEAKGLFVGLLFIAFSMVVGINSCSRMRTVAGRSKIELCGINLNMDSETARRSLHHFCDSNYRNAAFSVVIKGNMHSISATDSISGASVTIEFQSLYAGSPIFKSITYAKRDGVDLGLLKTYDGDISDYVGKNAGVELALNDTVISLKSR